MGFLLHVITKDQEPLIASLLLVAMPEAPSSDALAPSSVLAPSSKARSP